MQVRRLGEGLAVNLPDELVTDLGIEEGDELEIAARDGEWRLSLGSSRRMALAKLEALAVDAPLGFRFSRHDAHERHDR